MCVLSHVQTPVIICTLLSKEGREKTHLERKHTPVDWKMTNGRSKIVSSNELEGVEHSIQAAASSAPPRGRRSACFWSLQLVVIADTHECPARV